MSIDLKSNFIPDFSGPIDSRHWQETKELALANIPLNARYPGLTVYIALEETEYMFKGGIENQFFVKKEYKSSDSGNTGEDEVIDWAGEVEEDSDITEDNWLKTEDN